MKKRLLACLLTAAMLTSLFPVSALAAETGGLCPHHTAHTEDCGYAEEAEGQPCGFVCLVCPVQALIDALPAPADITPGNRAEVEARLAAIGEAWAGLSGEDALRLDAARLEAARDALAARDGQAGNGLPTAPAEDGGIYYLDEKGEEQLCEAYTTVSPSIGAWDGNRDSWHVAQGSIALPYAITVIGEVHLILMNGCDLKAYKGITVTNGSSLTIYAQSDGEGSLMTESEDTADAAIQVSSGSTVTINGGMVYATGYSGAGIGGSKDGDCGNITINGGTVHAASTHGAGIGGGQNGGGGRITINGGEVNANSDNGAGIGGGYGGDGSEITINGGTVNAASFHNGAGIGGGGDGAGGHITINGGEVNAYGVFGAGIGGGLKGDGGEIAISDGTVTAASEDTGAGIGGGQNGDGGKITVSGGTVKANGVNGAGIGGGYSGGGGEIAINGGIVQVGSYGGADIGGGCGGPDGGIVPSDKIEISENAKVTQGGAGEPNIGSAEHEAKKDEWVSDSTGHWYPCKAADCAENHQFNKAAHSFGDWNIDISATSTTAGSRHRDCSICQYTQTGTIPPVHSHSYGQGWKSNADGHWHECSCGDQSGYAAHTPGDWIVDQAATSSTAGSRHRECTACGYTTQTETIPATGGGSSSGGDSYTPPTYRPDVSQPSEGGSVSVSPSRPERGDTVTVKPQPDEGYEVEKITVTDQNGKPVEVTVKPDGTYTFKQPSGKVTIEVSYKAVEKPWSNPFTDVSEGDWYYEAVRFVQEQGLMNGIGNGNFAPNAQLSRAQLAQILFNKEGRPGVNYLLTFSDVAGEAWYTEAVRWAASQGIVGGYGNGTFGPNDPITREQLAVMLWRYSGSPAATNKELHFNDEAEISGFALEALRWAVENGILNGYGDGRLGPQGQATRAQVAQMLKNFIENQEDNI